MYIPQGMLETSIERGQRLHLPWVTVKMYLQSMQQSARNIGPVNTYMMYMYMYIMYVYIMYMYSRRHNKVSVPFLLPFRFLVVLPFLLPFVTVYNRSVF